MKKKSHKKTVIDELPKATVDRIVKNVLPDSAQISSDAKLAITKAAQVFILYLTATANDIREEKGKGTISTDHIIKALEDTEFGMFIESAKTVLEEKKNLDAQKTLNQITTATSDKTPPAKKKTSKESLTTPSKMTPTDPNKDSNTNPNKPTTIEEGKHLKKTSSSKTNESPRPVPQKPSPQISRNNTPEANTMKPNSSKETTPKSLPSSQGPSPKVTTTTKENQPPQRNHGKGKALDDIPTKSNKLKKHQLDDEDDPMENYQDDKPTPHRNDSPNDDNL